MDGFEFIIYTVKGLRLSDEEIAIGLKIVVKMLNYFGFCSNVKIYQNVGTKNKVKTLHEHHFVVVVEVQMREINHFFYFRGESKQSGVVLSEIFFAKIFRGVSD